MDEKRKHRCWFRFNLASFLACVTTCAVVLGVGRPWEYDSVSERQQFLRWVEESDGYAERWSKPAPLVIEVGDLRIITDSYQRVLGPQEEPTIPRWKERLGDRAVNRISLPRDAGETDLERARAMFPEAEVELAPKPTSGGGFAF
jgi:hypothetical protein